MCCLCFSVPQSTTDHNSFFSAAASSDVLMPLNTRVGSIAPSPPAFFSSRRNFSELSCFWMCTCRFFWPRALRLRRCRANHVCPPRELGRMLGSDGGIGIRGTGGGNAPVLNREAF